MDTSRIDVVFNTFFLSEKSVRNAGLLGGGICLFEVLLLLGAGYSDNSYYLDGPALGVMEHAGIWGIVIGDMFVFLVLSLLVKQIRKFTIRFPTTKSHLALRYVRTCRHAIYGSLKLRHRDRSIFIYATVSAIFFWANNAYQTRFPIQFYGNDLFDSIHFIHGYIATRIILGTSWILFIPYMAFASICIAASIYRMVNTCIRKRLLKFRFGHPDGCGGFSYLGNINLYFVIGILLIFLELTIVLFTHKKLNPGLASGFVMALILFLAASYFMLMPVYKFLAAEKRRKELKNYKSVRLAQLDCSILGSLYLFNQASFIPYKVPQRIVINIARLLPVIASSLKIYLSFQAAGT